MTTPFNCPACAEPTLFSKKRQSYFCAECESSFEGPIDFAVGLNRQTIFLSYAHRSEGEADFDISEELVLLIKEALQADGHTVWIDQDGIRSGSQWREQITDAILGHTHFLSFLSRRSVRDPGVCLNEIAIALGKDRHIQTLLTAGEQSVSPPLTISHIQWHDFRQWREIRDGLASGPGGQAWPAWFAARMDGIRAVIADARNARVTGELQTLREVLRPRSFEARIIEKTEGFFGREWLFDETRRWLDQSSSRLFWLKAGPGIGKSAFAAKLVHCERSAVIGFFMCDFQGQKSPEDSAREAICTLAYQMASRLPDYRSKLLYQQMVDLEQVAQKTPDDLFEYLITEALNTSGKIPEATRMTLVIDGLDEAGRNDGSNALAELLNKHADKLPPWLGIVVTSRPEPYLEQMLGRFQTTAFQADSQQNLDDLREYISNKLAPDLVAAERARVIEAVLAKSGGAFLYLRLVEQDASLDMSRPESLPEKLDGFFKLSFQRYFPDADAYGSKTEPFLRLLAAAPGPLPRAMGCAILAWNLRKLTLCVTEPLGSLLLDKEQQLSFFHASLSDWLKEPARSGSHCVSDSGAKELGQFLWAQFKDFDTSDWKPYVMDWLPGLLPATSWWTDVSALDALGSFYDQKGHFRQALLMRKQQLERVSQNPDSPDLVLAHALLATALEKAGQLPLAEQHSQLALAHSLKHHGEHHPTTADCQHELGGLLRKRGQFDASEALYKQSLDVRARIFGYEHLDTALSMNGLANLLWSRRRYLEAEPLYRQVLTIREQQLGSEHIETAKVVSNLGVLLRGMDQLDEAHALQERCLAIRQKQLGDGHPAVASTLENLALVLKAKGDLALSQQYYERSLEIRERTLGSEHPDTAKGMNNLANLLKSRCNYDGAEALYRRAVEIKERALGLHHPSLALSLNNLAGLLKTRGQLSSAEQLYERALQIRHTVYGPADERTQKVRELLDDVRHLRASLPAEPT